MPPHPRQAQHRKERKEPVSINYTGYQPKARAKALDPP